MRSQLESLLTIAFVTLLCTTGMAPAAPEIDGISGASYEMPPALPRDEAEVQTEIQQWLAGHWLMTLATSESDGEPHISGVVYYANKFNVYFASSRFSNKIRNIDRDPRVAYTIWDPVTDIRQLKALQVRGRARILEGEERESASTQFAGHPFSDDYAVVEITPLMARWTDRSRAAEYTSVVRFDGKDQD